MKTLAQHIFSEFKEKIMASLNYHPITALETLKARLTATWLLQSEDPMIVKQAEMFLEKTSLFKKEDLFRLKDFSLQVKTWDKVHVCSTYTNAAGIFLEYKLSFTTLNNIRKTMHFHACYQINKQACYFVSQTSPLIRVIGDPVLHKPGKLFPNNPTIAQFQELEKQIEHAKTVLIQTGGAGIAANQCAWIEDPYCFTIVGVFYEIPEHVTGVNKRYPNTSFPAARIILNPEITYLSKETQHFNHACLSVPCSNRCEVKSPIKISIRYQDPIQTMATKHADFEGIEAVVLWHELTHILEGKTYIDVTLESLSLEALFQFQTMLFNELEKRNQAHHKYLPELSVPPFHVTVKINNKGVLELNKEELALVLPKMTDETLAGILIRAKHLLKKYKTLLNDESLVSFRCSMYQPINTVQEEEVCSLLSKL